MSRPAEMKVVFRLGKVGMTLPVERLIEIVEISKRDVERRSDAEPHSLGRVTFRDASLPLTTLHAYFGVPRPPLTEGVWLVLVVGSAQEPWGLVVDEVVGIFRAREFIGAPLSPLFSMGEEAGYAQVDIWRGEPLVCWEPERYVPSGVVA